MVPQHIHPIECNISCKSKFLLLIEKHVTAILSRRQPTGLCFLAAYWSHRVQYLLPKHYRPPNIHRPGMNGYEQGLRYQKFICRDYDTRPFLGYHCFGCRLYWIKWNNKHCFLMAKCIILLAHEENEVL